jgi:hypothetical protein
MECHKCKKDIDFELSNDEELEFKKQLKQSKVIVLCIECYEEVKSATDIR